MLTRNGERPGRSLTDALDSQVAAIGALLLREMQTRYGRDNIGYLWLLVEPMLLAGAVTLIHAGNTGSGPHGSDFRVISFSLTGYCVFMIFRSIVSRAETTLEANKPLLFHRTVTVLDMLIARALLETLSSIGALAILLAGAVALGLADPPARPLLLLSGIAFVAWLSFALSLSVCAATHFSKAIAKLVHPFVYLVMPLSGAFFLLRWIPERYRDLLSWSPLNQAFEMVHMGQFESVNTVLVDPLYVAFWCLCMTIIGFLSLRILRQHLHLG